MSRERSRHHDDPIHAPATATASGTPGRIMRTAMHRNSAPAAAEQGAEAEPFEESTVLVAHDVPIVVQRFSFDSALSLGGTSTGGGGGGGHPLPKSWHEDDEERKKRREEKRKQRKRGFGPGRE